jgi:hypothetical protein
VGRFRSLLRAAVDCAFAQSGHRGPDVVLDSARSILLTLDNSISVRFSLKRDSYQTATRRLANFLVVRHYYALACLGVTERGELTTRAERGRYSHDERWRQDPRRAYARALQERGRGVTRTCHIPRDTTAHGPAVTRARCK